jgi:hypothetical protein
MVTREQTWTDENGTRLTIVCGVGPSRSALFEAFRDEVLRRRPGPFREEIGAEVRLAGEEGRERIRGEARPVAVVEKVWGDRFLAVTRGNIFFIFRQDGPVVGLADLEASLTEAVGRQPPWSQADSFRPKVIECRERMDMTRVPLGSSPRYTIRLDGPVRIVQAGIQVEETGAKMSCLRRTDALHLGVEATREGTYHVVLWMCEGRQLPVVLRRELTVVPVEPPPETPAAPPEVPAPR